MKSVVLILLALTTSVSFAGDKIGNGGGVWACIPGAHQPATQLLLVDFYEAREQQGQNGWTIPPAPSGLTPMQYADQKAKEFERDFASSYAGDWSESLELIKAHLRYVNADLASIDDALFKIIPPANQCVGDWTYTQFANFTEQGQVLVSAGLWNSPLLTVEEKAGLIWHETIYAWLRLKFMDKDSVRARYITGLLFSTEPVAEKTRLLSEVLDQAPPPNETKSWFCRLQNRLTNELFGADGSSRQETEAEVTRLCQAGGNSFNCAFESVQCLAIPSENLTWTCNNQNSLTSEIYTSRGRNRLEAEFRSQASCQAAHRQDLLHCTTLSPVCSELH